ncbi:MAG: YIP1 family protein, partial [Microcystis panniformis]
MKQLIQALALLGLLGIAGLLLLFLAPSWPTLFGVLVLDPRAFITIKSLRFGLEEAIIVVFIASVSEAIGQSFVLFINRIPPSRFIFSLLITSILYAFNFGIWAAGLWLVTILLFRGDTRLFEVASTLGFSYAPFIFGLAIALPYAGRAIYILLILWSVAALAVGLTVLLNI